MANIADYEDMPITKVVAQFMNVEGWTDEITVSDDRSSSTVGTEILLEQQDYQLYIEANEAIEVLDVYMYDPFSVPVNRIDVKFVAQHIGQIV